MKNFVIFDLDGTLLNTLDDLANAGNHALDKENLPTHPVDAYRMFVGRGIPKLITSMTPEPLREDLELFRRLKASFDAYYGIHGQDLTRPYDGILPMLDSLLAKGKRLAVLSNKAHPFVQTLVPHYFGDRFEVILGNREGYPTKPDGSLVREVLEQLSASAKETAYVGDSGIDMQTAQNGNTLAVGVLWGFRDRQELLKNGAEHLIASPMELANLLESLA